MNTPMTDEQVLEKLIVIAVETGKVARERVTMETRVLDDLGLDSLTITDLIIKLEKVFGFEFNEEDLFKIVTVRNLVHIIQSHINRP